MNLYEMIKQINAGGLVAVIVLLLSFIEITPIKLSPLRWIGERVNQGIMSRLGELETKVNDVSDNLDEHIAQSFRNKILTFFDDVVNRGMKKTLEQWKEIIKACANYEAYVKEHHLINGDAVEAIDYLRDEYQRCLRDRDFLNVIVNKSN